MRILLGLGGVVAATIAGGVIWLNTSDIGRIYIPSGIGITAKQACSLSFVSGLDTNTARAMYTAPLLGDIDKHVSVNVDRYTGEVTASIYGLFTQRAIYREGLGCTLIHGGAELNTDTGLLPLGGEPTVLDTAHRDAHFDTEALNAAMDAAFTDDGRNTLGVVVLHEGELVAERYADGVTAFTPLHGWSMTKSVAATMAGVLTQRGLMDVHAAGRVPALLEAGRPEITVDDLLRMTGGLAGYELNNGRDPNSDMLFTERDMATFAATRQQIAAPGERWDYQSGNTVLAGSALETYLGDTPEAKTATIRARLFEPLGMAHSVLEADQAGTLMWSSYMYASARDWARLGQLYIDDGRAPDGTQLIPENWIDYVSAPTPGSDGDYGSGFWMYDVGLPEDSFIMNGFQGQLGYIIPSQDLVIVRLGATNFQHDGSPELARAVVQARLQEVTDQAEDAEGL
jgi:CubicO group peptidase (beta-lactamase class C family)